MRFANTLMFPRIRCVFFQFSFIQYGRTDSNFAPLLLLLLRRHMCDICASSTSSTAQKEMPRSGEVRPERVRIYSIFLSVDILEKKSTKSWRFPITLIHSLIIKHKRWSFCFCTRRIRIILHEVVDLILSEFVVANLGSKVQKQEIEAKKGAPCSQ